MGKQNTVEKIYRSIIERAGARTERTIRRAMTGTDNTDLTLDDLQQKLLDEYLTPGDGLTTRDGVVYFDAVTVGQISGEDKAFTFRLDDEAVIPEFLTLDGDIQSTSRDGVMKKLRALQTKAAENDNAEEKDSADMTKINEMNEKRKSRKAKAQASASDDSDALDSDSSDSDSDAVESSASDAPKKSKKDKKSKAKKDKVAKKKRTAKSDSSASDASSASDDPLTDNAPARGDDAKTLSKKKRALNKLLKGTKKKKAKAEIEAVIAKVEKALARAKKKKESAKSDSGSDADPATANKPKRGDDAKTLGKKRRALKKALNATKKKKVKAELEAVLAKVERAYKKAKDAAKSDDSDKPAKRGRKPVEVDMKQFKKKMKMELRDGRTGVVDSIDKDAKVIVFQPDTGGRTKRAAARFYRVKGKKIVPA